MDRPFPAVLDVPVAGGSLRVGLAGPERGAPVVLAVHGITASHRSWSAVARHLGQDVTFLAPDLRGRGASSGLPPPYGCAAHLDDLLAVLDYAGAIRVVLAGHSMGAWVVARLAAAHPDRAAAVVLVDGGLPLSAPVGVDPDSLLAAVLGPALARLQMTFPTVDAYRDFWRAHPAFGPAAWSPDIEDFVDYDLVPAVSGPRRSRVSEEAVRVDGRDMLDVDAARAALLSLACPTLVVRAPRGILDEPRPLLPDEALAAARAGLPHLAGLDVPDTNHYLLVMRDREAGVVAGEILALATAG